MSGPVLSVRASGATTQTANKTVAPDHALFGEHSEPGAIAELSPTANQLHHKTSKTSGNKSGRARKKGVVGSDSD